MRRLSLTLLTLVALPASAYDIAGSWEGKIACGGVEHAVRLDFTKDGGTVDMPDQYAAAYPLAAVSSTATTIRFAFRDPLPKALFTGMLARGRMSGRIETQGATGATFELDRRPRPAEAFRVTPAGRGTLYLPMAKGPHPAIVLLGRDSVRFVAQQFARGGIAALIANDDDAAAAVTELRSRDDIHARRIGILALAPGASIAKTDASFVIVASGTAVPGTQPLLVATQRLHTRRAAGCGWLGDVQAEGWIDRSIAWALRQPNRVTTATEGRSLFDAATRAARNGEAGEALSLLDRAIEDGFDDTAQLENDADLVDLATMSGFDSIVQKSNMLEFPCAPSAPRACWEEKMPRLQQAHIEYPHSGRAAFNLGLAAQKLGDHATAAPAFAEAVALRYKPAVSAFDAALSYGKAGDRQQMLRWLDRSLELGFPVQRLIADAGFASLREDADVKALITRYGTNWPDM